VTALIAALSGIAVALGLWLAMLAGASRIVVVRRERPERTDRATSFDSRDAAFAVVAVIVALAVVLTTHLAVAALAAALGVMLIPRVIRARVERERAIAKMRAAAEFVEAIRGSLGAGSGLEAAILESARRPPDGLARELSSFVAYSRLPEVTTEQALRRLADEAREPAIDLLVGSLLAALRGAAGDMGRLFERIADQGRSFAETRALTQAERARVEFQTKILSLLVIGVALLSVVVSPDLTSAYGPSAIGQLRLTIPVVVFAFGWWWLIRMNRVEGQYRFRLRVASATTARSANAPGEPI
jgi:Flp pilus assembly protein TadB